MTDVETQSLKLFFGCVQFNPITSTAERNAKLGMHTRALDE